MLTNSKITVAGNHIEVLNFKNPIFYGYVVKKPAQREPRIIDPIKVSETREKSLRRSRSHVKRLINKNNFHWQNTLGQNYNPEFITLTFKENIQDLNYANREFSKFIQRLNHLINGKQKQLLHYLGVVEFQERGAIHYHVLFFNLPFIKNVYDELRKLWTFGSINLQSVKHIKHIANYVCKYMVKNFEDPRLVRRKSYFPSRGLLKPKVSRDQSYNTGIILFLDNKYMTYQKKVVDDHLGEIEYLKYELPNDDPILPKIN